MPITESQRKKRKNYLGSSDSPAVLGVDPWRNAHDVYLSKTADLVEQEDSEAIEIGNDFEEPLLSWAARQLGVPIKMNVQGIHSDHEVIAAQLDAKVKWKRVGIEGKTTSLGGEYGDEGTDQVPDRVIIQTQQQMAVHRLDTVWVAVLTAEYDRLKRKLYKVDRNEKLIDIILERGLGFWYDHVAPRIPPGSVLPSVDLIARIRRVPDKMVEVDTSLHEALEDAKGTLRRAEQEVEEARAKLLLAAGDAEGIDFGSTSQVYTYLEQTRTTIDRKRLERERPAIAKKYLKESRPFRVLRLSKHPKLRQTLRPSR